MKGMNIDTGRSLAGNDYLIQTIENFLFTDKGSRVLVRNYGVEFYIDDPNTPETQNLIISGIFEELLVFQKNLNVLSVTLDPPATDSTSDSRTSIEITIQAETIPNRNIILIQGILP